MRRTRKWSSVAQEATRLAAMGLSPKDIAERLGVNKSSVTRWIRKGKLARESVKRQTVTVSSTAKTPDGWAKAIRAAYALDATDEQLVMLAVQALKMSRDINLGPQARMAASGRFQALVKQLRLVARTETQQPPAPATEEPKRKTFTVPKRSGTDPRALLTAVK